MNLARIRSQVLTPMAGIDVRTSSREWFFTRASTWVEISLPAQRQELFGEFGQHDPGRVGAHDRSLVQVGEHDLGRAISEACLYPRGCV